MISSCIIKCVQTFCLRCFCDVGPILPQRICFFCDNITEGTKSSAFQCSRVGRTKSSAFLCFHTGIPISPRRIPTKPSAKNITGIFHKKTAAEYAVRTGRHPFIKMKDIRPAQCINHAAVRSRQDSNNPELISHVS